MQNRSNAHKIIAFSSDSDSAANAELRRVLSNWEGVRRGKPFPIPHPFDASTLVPSNLELGPANFTKDPPGRTAIRQQGSRRPK